jgi:hypothetical protein
MLPYQSTTLGIRSQIHLQIHVEAISRTEGKDYCPLAVALVQVIHEKDVTAPFGLDAKLHCG